MAQSPTLQSGHTISLLECWHADKTFPKLPMQLRKADSDHSRETIYQATMKEYEKKFYQDQIRMLLSKYRKMSIKANRQECEIERMKTKMEAMNHVKRSFSQSQRKASGTNFHNDEDKFSQKAAKMLGAKLKRSQDLKICDTKTEHDHKLKQKEKEHEEKVKQMKFEHICKVIKLKQQMECTGKQKQLLECEFKQLKSIQLPNLNEANINELIQIQNLKQENALLRSFIYKAQIVQDQIQQIEHSRIKERMQFVQFAKQAQISKKKLDEELNLERNLCEEKIKTLQSDFAKKMHEKAEKLIWLQQENEKLKIQSEMIKSHAEQSMRQSMNQSVLEQTEMMRKNEIQLQFSVKNTQSQIAELQHVNQKKQEQIAKLSAQIEETNSKQLKYYRQIERLRIERNQFALQNAELEHKIHILRQEMRHICEQQSKQLDNVSRKFCDFDMNDGITQHQEFNLQEIKQIKKKISELEQQIEEQKDNHQKSQQKFNAIELYYKGRESSYKLSKEMAQNSYKQIWQKQRETTELLSVQRNNRECLQKQADELKMKFFLSQQRASLFRQEKQKQKSLLRVQLSTLRQKHENMKKQYDESLAQKNRKHEQLELKIFRLSKQLQDTTQNNKYQRGQQVKRMEREILSKSEQINKLQQQIKQIQQHSENRHSGELAQLKEKIQLESKKVQLLQQNVISTRNSFNQIISEKQSIICFLKSQADQKQFKVKLQTKQKPNLDQYSKASESRFSNSKNSISHIYQHLVEQESIEEESKIQEYQQQILHINSNHQQEVDHLKSYIYDLLEDNDKLKENYMIANNSWKRMYAQVQKYNKYLAEGEQQVDRSTIRKREIERKIGKDKRSHEECSKKRSDTARPLCELQMTKNEEMFSEREINSESKFEIISLPSLSSSKLGQVPIEKEIIPDMRVKERPNRNRCRQIEDELQGCYNGTNREQQNLNVSNIGLMPMTQNSLKIKNKKSEVDC